MISGNTLDGVLISDNGTSDNLVAGNLIGTTVSGDTAMPNGAILYYGTVAPGNGVAIQGGATANTVGGTTAGAGNVISGNTLDGVLISDNGTSDNLVAGNLIGTTVSGDTAMPGIPNQYSSQIIQGHGVVIQDGATSNTVGSAVAGAGNVISGNTNFGVWITSGAASNTVVANDIGTDSTGHLNLGNALGGVEIDSEAAGNTIGGTTAEMGNMIADNGGPGVQIQETFAIGNSITADRIFGNTGPTIAVFSHSVIAMSATTGGQVLGWLHGGRPDQTYRIDVLRQLQLTVPTARVRRRTWLGSLDGDDRRHGQAVFAGPLHPAGRACPCSRPRPPTPRATPPKSRRSGRAAFQVPTRTVRGGPIRRWPSRPRPGDAIAIQDPNAGPLDPAVEPDALGPERDADLVDYGRPDRLGRWDRIALVQRPALGPRRGAGRDDLHAAAGLPGPSHAEPRTPSPFGAAPIQAQMAIEVTDGVFLVTTTADSGPGSLRQAILDSNAAAGGDEHDRLRHPGAVVCRRSTSALAPAADHQPGRSSTAPPSRATRLTADCRHRPGHRDADPLTVGSDVTVRGLAIDGYQLSTSGRRGRLLRSIRASARRTRGGAVTYPIDSLTAGMQDLQGTAPDRRGTSRVSCCSTPRATSLVQSDGPPEAVLADADRHLPRGRSLHRSEVQGVGGVRVASR